MPLFKPRKIAKGFSLIEVLVVGGLLGGLALVVGSLVKTGSQGQKTLQAQDDARVLTQDMAALLSNPTACANTFGGAAGSPNPSKANPVDGAGTSVNNIVDGNLKAQFTNGNTYGNRGLKLAGITIGGTGADPKTNIQKWTSGAAASTGTAFVQVNWLQTGSSGNIGTGPQNLYRYFMVFVSNLGPGNQIVNCTAQAGGASGYWTLNADNNIYNNNNGGTGLVGIGTTTPATTLDVNGGIRAAANSPGASCAPTGTAAYDPSSGAPLYCDSTAHWKANSALPGTLCGMVMYLSSGCESMSSGGPNVWQPASAKCNGVDPHTSCPSGYTFTQLYGANCNTAFSCVKN